MSEQKRPRSPEAPQQDGNDPIADQVSAIVDRRIQEIRAELSGGREKAEERQAIKTFSDLKDAVAEKKKNWMIGLILSLIYVSFVLTSYVFTAWRSGWSFEHLIASSPVILFCTAIIGVCVVRHGRASKLETLYEHRMTAYSQLTLLREGMDRGSDAYNELSLRIAELVFADPAVSSESVNPSKTHPNL